MTTLNELWRSSRSLIDRFYPQKRPTRSACINKFQEECREFIEELQYNKRNLIAAELVDVIVTGINAAAEAGVTLEEVMTEMQNVIDKNDAKTDKTHFTHPITGTIERRAKFPELQ